MLALVLATAGAAARPTANKQVKHTTGFIESLAIDGAVVAYDVQGGQPQGPACNRVFAWNISTKRRTRAYRAGHADGERRERRLGSRSLTRMAPSSRVLEGPRPEHDRNRAAEGLAFRETASSC